MSDDTTEQSNRGRITQLEYQVREMRHRMLQRADDMELASATFRGAVEHTPLADDKPAAQYALMRAEIADILAAEFRRIAGTPE